MARGERPYDIQPTILELTPTLLYYYVFTLRIAATQLRDT